MTDIVIRRAEPSDAEGVASTFRSREASAGTLQNPYPSIAFWTERLGRNTSSQLNYVLVALADGHVIGHAGLHGNENPRRAHVWYLGMSVHEDWHARGLGALRIELTVYCDNEPAMKLYRKFGFEIEGTHRAFALRDGQYIDSYAMARLHPRPPRLNGSGGASA